MIKVFKASIFPLLLMIFLFARGHGQEANFSPSQGMNRAMAEFKAGRYAESFRQFDRLATLYPLDERQSIFQYMAAKSLYYDGKYEAAIQKATRFLKEFSQSTLSSACKLILAASQYALGDFLESAKTYVEIIDSSGSPPIKEAARKNLMALLRSELTANELISLAKIADKSRMAEDIWYYIGVRHFEMKSYDDAIIDLQAYLDKFPVGRYRENVSKMLGMALVETGNRIKLGILAPISGPYAEYGKNLVDGASLAFDNFTIGGKKIQLLIKDTEGSPVKAVQATRELISEKPVAIIGPLRSETAVGAATAASSSGIPVILPTASEKDLSLLSDNVFQISPPAEKMAEAVAEYAVLKLGLKEFGVISPSDISSRQITSAFTNKIYELGGQVVSVTFYDVGQTDFAAQIKPLRDALLIKTEELLALKQTDSTLYFDTLTQKWLDQKDWRVFLDGLFLPGDAAELAMLVPQVRYNVITTRYFGLYGWDSQVLIERIGGYLEGAVFAADYHIAENSESWRRFSRLFESKTNRKPDRIAALAFDAASIIKEALLQGRYESASILAYINAIDDREGIGCRIDFSGNERTNSAVEIYMIRNGAVVKTAP